ncbi:hypothetical protein FXO37_30048 [Capsicum annuum]|nr:hypothetical protein FXO37_30048 [Capsicum annuum]
MLNHLRFLCIVIEVKSLSSSFPSIWNIEIMKVENEGSTLIILKIPVLRRSITDSSFIASANSVHVPFKIGSRAQKLEIFAGSYTGNSNLGCDQELSHWESICKMEIWRECFVGQCCNAGDNAISVDDLLFSKLWHM